MISAEERRRRAGDLGVPESQVARDHLISHVLHALAQLDPGAFVFFGGTALCRTWCDDVRLSEDVDLLVDDLASAAKSILPGVVRGIRRDFPRASWEDLGNRHEVETRMLDAGDGLRVKLQIARWPAGWRFLPVARTSVSLRYSDLPRAVSLTVPTPASFATMKLAAWCDRHAPRDLFDLRELAARGLVTAEVLDLFQRLTGGSPSSATVSDWIPLDTAKSWAAELGEQTGALPPPQECLAAVLRALDEARASRGSGAP